MHGFNVLFLTRRNLLTLLNKLDRKKKGEATERTLIKWDTKHPKFPCTAPTVVQALEDEEYYTERMPGEVHPTDNPAYKEETGS